jgi:tight adherence protein B
MSLLPVFFMLMLVVVFVGMLAAMRPSPEEKVMQARIVDIRNPRRQLREDSGDAELMDLEERGMSQQLGAYLQQYSATAKLEKLLLEADSPTPVGSLVLTSLAAGFAAGFVGFFLLRSIPAGIGGTLVGLAFPIVRLKMKRKKRLKAVTEALPDAADLMARALRSGHSMTQSIELLGEQARQPLGAEFERVFQQQKLGMQLRDVLVEMGERLPSRDLQFLITAVLVQRETGGDLSSVLDRTAAVLRERIQLQSQVQIHTAQGRLTGWILSLMPVVLLLAMTVFSPTYAHGLFGDPMGRMMLYAAAGFIVVGALVIRKIVGVQV